MKKSNVFEKAKTKSGVIEGGINELVKKVKNTRDDDFRWSDEDSCRVCFYAPRKISNHYKAILTEQGITIQSHLLSYIRNFVEEADKKAK